MQTANEKLQYISEMTNRLLQLSEELNMSTLSYLLRMARLEAEITELTAQLTSGDRCPPGQRSN
jgi:hypothetical protein